jgi:dihydropyrimidinase
LDADLMIFDPEERVVISREILHEEVDWTPYEGLNLKGWPQATISRGEIIVENGEFKGQAGRGRFIRRHF